MRDYRTITAKKFIVERMDVSRWLSRSQRRKHNAEEIEQWVRAFSALKLHVKKLSVNGTDRPIQSFDPNQTTLMEMLISLHDRMRLL